MSKAKKTPNSISLPDPVAGFQAAYFKEEKRNAGERKNGRRKGKIRRKEHSSLYDPQPWKETDA